MPRFLHLADIHLGFDRYNHPQRTQDFYFALEDVICRYALEPPVDFVLMAGDLFEHRNILPAILNQAKTALNLLSDAGIPVITIEGNHDHTPYGTRTSWLRYLADWNHVILLEPQESEAVDEIYQPWDPDSKRGGYIDLPCGVRVLGSRWYGSSAPQAIQKLAAGLGTLPPAPGPSVMLLHHGLEGEIARYSGALKYSELQPLREAGIHYLALGHIHKNYARDNWIFNPGSLEANSVAEAREGPFQRGVYVVELSDGQVKADLKQDYLQRPIRRLSLEAQKDWSLETLEQAAIALIRQAAQTQPSATQGAIVELRLRGQVGFPRLDLDVRRLREQLQELSQALIFLLKYEVIGTEYETFVSPEEQLSREAIETVVFKDLLAANVSYAAQPERLDPLVQGLIDLKDQILVGRTEAELYQVFEALL